VWWDKIWKQKLHSLTTYELGGQVRCPAEHEVITINCTDFPHWKLVFSKKSIWIFKFHELCSIFSWKVLYLCYIKGYFILFRYVAVKWILTLVSHQLKHKGCETSCSQFLRMNWYTWQLDLALATGLTIQRQTTGVACAMVLAILQLYLQVHSMGCFGAYSIGRQSTTTTVLKFSQQQKKE